MFDIEDKLIDIVENTSNQVSQNPATSQPQPQPSQQQAPEQGQSQTETPPTVTPGNPAPVDAGALEDTSNLRGSARSTAVLRNVMKKQRLGIKED